MSQQNIAHGNFLDIVFNFYERMQEFEENYQFLSKLQFGVFLTSILSSSKIRNLHHLYHCAQKHLYLLVKRRVDASNILTDITNVRFYLKDAHTLKQTIFSEVKQLCDEPTTLRVISQQLDFYLKNGSKLLSSMEPAVRDILEKSENELADLVSFYDCFRGDLNEKKQFLKLVNRCYKEIMLKHPQDGTLIQQFLKYDSKIKELCGIHYNSYAELTNTMYKTAADDVLGANMNGAQEVISYIQSSWDLTKNQSFEELEKMLTPALKYIDVVSDKDKLEMNIHTFFFVQTLAENADLPRIHKLFEFLFKNYGNALSKVKRLLKDIKEGNSICEEYNEQKHKVSITLISNLVWPNLLFNIVLLKEMRLHPSLLEINKGFEEFYMQKFKHRQLMFVPLFGVVEVQERTQGVARSITVNPLQASILMMFNTQDTVSLKSLTETFGASHENIKNWVSALVPEILNTQGEEVAVVKPGSGFGQSQDVGDSSTNVFAENKYFVSFATQKVFTSGKKAPEGDFTLMIQSYVIRVMKQKLELDYNGIKQGVENMTQSRFEIKDKEFNTALDKLIERGFLSCEDFENYKYV